jgi:hypothetical protein
MKILQKEETKNTFSNPEIVKSIKETPEFRNSA